MSNRQYLVQIDSGYNSRLLFENLADLDAFVKAASKAKLAEWRGFYQDKTTYVVDQEIDFLQQEILVTGKRLVVVSPAHLELLKAEEDSKREAKTAEAETVEEQ